MIYAVITAILFAGSAACSRGLVGVMGSATANVVRLSLAAIVLAVLTLATDAQSFHLSSFGWFLVSGMIGFGIGDVALFAAYPRIGSRLTMLLIFSVGTLVGAMADWLILGQEILLRQWPPVCLILLGLGVAVMTKAPTGMKREGSWTLGLICGVIAGLGQGLGATTSIVAQDAAAAVGLTVSPISQAFQRVLAGLAVAWLYWGFFTNKTPRAKAGKSTQWRLFLFGAAILGPVIGVSCFQMALTLQPSGIVLAVVATSPLLLIPVAWAWENDRPSLVTLLATLCAVIGVGWLAAVTS